MATRQTKNLAILLMLLGWLACIISLHFFDYTPMLLASVIAMILGFCSMALNDRIQKQNGKPKSSLINVAGIFLLFGTVGTLLHGPVAPQMQETQIRALKSRTSTDFRIIGKALEDYHNDHGVWPETLYPVLTSPHAYLAETIQLDPFSKQPYHYFHNTDDWLLIGTGPDKQLSLDPKNDVLTTQTLHVWPMTYDPTNGIKSRGDVFWSRSKALEMQ